MRNGGTIRFSFRFETLLPTPADADPATVEVLTRSPAGTEVEYVFGIDPEVVKDSVGDYHFDSPPLDEAPGGVWAFVARGDGYPETKCEITVEPSYW